MLLHRLVHTFLRPLAKVLNILGEVVARTVLKHSSANREWIPNQQARILAIGLC